MPRGYNVESFQNRSFGTVCNFGDQSSVFPVKHSYLSTLSSASIKILNRKKRKHKGFYIACQLQKKNQNDKTEKFRKISNFLPSPQVGKVIELSMFKGQLPIVLMKKFGCLLGVMPRSSVCSTGGNATILYQLTLLPSILGNF